MAVMQSIVVVSALMLVLMVQQGTAIKCYECNSHNDSRCAQDIPPQELSVTCDHHKTVCRKVTQEIDYSLDGKGGAIQCYECNSYNDSRCALDIPPQDLSIDCGNHQKGVKFTFCRKIKQIIEFSVNNLPVDTRIIRLCGWDDSSFKGKCYSRSGFGGRQEVCACESDNCNGASTHAMSRVTVGCVTIGVVAVSAIIGGRM